MCGDQDCCSPSGPSFTHLTLAIRASSSKSAVAAQIIYVDLQGVSLSYRVQSI